MDRDAWLAEQARNWILVWNDGDPRSLPLADEFEHTSPYGVLTGREHYLDTVMPQAATGVMRLVVDDVLASGERAVIRYRMESKTGSVTPACDWLEFDEDRLARVWSYYDRT